MRIVNVLAREGADVVVVGNRPAIKALVDACIVALMRGEASADVSATDGRPYRVRVERVDAIADLVKLPLR